MDAHTLERLEFGKVLDRIAGLCMLSLGAEGARALRPMDDLERIKTRSQRIAEGVAILAGGHDFPVERFDDPKAMLDRAGIEGMALRPDELQTVAAILRNARDLQKAFSRRAAAPSLAKLSYDLAPHPDLLKEIDRCIAPDGTVADDASAELKRLRREMAALQDRIRTRLEALIQNADVQPFLTGDYVTQRNGRNVVPIVAAQSGQVPGIIHDRSDTGHTVFVEPTFVVEMGNALRGLASDEAREIQRILRELTDGVRAHLEPLRLTVRTVVQFDLLRACARYAAARAMTRPAFSTDGVLTIVGGRHPVLEDALASSAEAVVPLDFTLGGPVRTVAITGANAGGKTVALKTIGLLCLMAQTGLMTPAEKGSTFVVLRNVLVDIGDEQSIEANLSTFSGHIRHIREVLSAADDATLVLLDEIGAGTDPVEGGALACAIVGALHGRGAMTVVTTHLSQVKGFVHEHDGMENAAVQFDPETLSPTYELIVGRPGASHALQIAERYGLPGDVLAGARQLVDSEAIEMEGLLARLTASLKKAEADAHEAQRERAHAEKARKDLARQLEDLKKERKESLRRAVAEAQGLVENTRREMQQALDEARRAGADAAATKHLRHKVEAKRDRFKKKSRELAPTRRPPLAIETIRVGQVVYVETMQRHATVSQIDLKRGRVTLDAGGLAIEAGAAAIRQADEDAAKAEAAPQPQGRTVVKPAATAVAPELNMRGMRVDEAARALEHYLNEACVAGLGSVRLIHGHGTGALREMVQRELKGHPLVESSRFGEWGEGGRGVTVAVLK